MWHFYTTLNKKFIFQKVLRSSPYFPLAPFSSSKGFLQRFHEYPCNFSLFFHMFCLIFITWVTSIFHMFYFFFVFQYYSFLCYFFHNTLFLFNFLWKYYVKIKNTFFSALRTRCFIFSMMWLGYVSDDIY